MTVSQKIERVVKAFKAKPHLGALVLLGSLADVISTLSVNGTDVERLQLASDIKAAWHEHVTPLNLPGVPDTFEPMVDALIEQGVSASVDAGLEQIAAFRAEVDAIVNAA